MIVDVLAYRLLSEPALHDTVVKHRQRLKWAAAHNGESMWAVVGTVLDYDEKHGKLPGLKALWEFCTTSPDILLSRRAELIRSDLESLKTIDKELLAQFTDVDVLIEHVVTEARKTYHTYIYQKAGSVVNQGQGASNQKDAPVGPDGAMAWVRKMWSYDLVAAATDLAGIWQDNTETLKQLLADYRTQKTEGRVKTGFPKIDANFVIKPGKTLFIGGSSGDGKSTLLHSMVYNMAQAGEHVLYVSLEFEPTEIWEFLAFIHTHQFRNRMFLPSQNTWQLGAATDEDQQNMTLVIDDIKQRTLVPGLIDVQKFFNWDEIEQYWEANNAKNQYTAVVVDYIYKLTPPANKYVKETEAKNTIISRAITWTHTKASFVLISPSQVNREAHKAAKKDGSSGYDLDSLYASSAAQQDTDLAISVFSSEDDRMFFNMSVKCLKHRGTEAFNTHTLNMDPRTKYVRDGDEVKAEVAAKGKRDVAEIWARQQEKDRLECERTGKVFVPTEIGGSQETVVTIPDTEKL